MIAWRAVILTALLAACEAQEQDRASNNSQQALFVALHSEDVIAGSRPQLTLSCGPAGASFWLQLAATPSGPFLASFKFDDGKPVRLELAPLGAERWAPRINHRQESELVRAMAAANNIYFHGPEGQTERVIRWDLGRLGASLAQVREACAAIRAPP